MSRVGFTEAIRTKTVQNIMMLTAMQPPRKLKLAVNLLRDLFLFDMKIQ